MAAILPRQEQSQRPVEASQVAVGHWVDDQMAGVRRRRGGTWAAMVVAYGLGLAASGGLWLLGRPAAAIIVLGCVGLVAAAWAGVSLLRRMLTAGHPVIAVARAIVEEALGGRLGAVLAVLVLIGLPALPFALETRNMKMAHTVSETAAISMRLGSSST